MLPNAIRTARTIDAGILWLEDGDGRLASVVVLSSTATDYGFRPFRWYVNSCVLTYCSGCFAGRIVVPYIAGLFASILRR